MPQYYSQQELRTRGWTILSTKALLSVPDLLRPNQQNRKRPVKLFEHGRVHIAERSPIFLKHCGKSQLAKTKAQQKQQTARQQAATLINLLPINVPNIKLSELRKIARKRITADFFAVNPEGEPNLSDSAVKAAMVLHLSEVSNPSLPTTVQIDSYGTVLGYLQGKVYAQIASKYPSLKSFCC